jgi:ankyrin repeat protein
MSDLTDAIKQGDLAAAVAVLDDDPSLLHVPEGNVTPLMLAVYHGKHDLARLLVDRGARVSFGEAVALGDAERVRAMLAKDPSLLEQRTPDGFPPVGLAIFFRHGGLARWLIEQGADVSAPAENVQKVAPVHAAAAVCDRDTMRLLLERGADANARQQLDYTALHGAASRGDVEMAKLLLAHGADRTAQGSDGLSVDGIARKYGQTAFADWFANA